MSTYNPACEPGCHVTRVDTTGQYWLLLDHPGHVDYSVPTSHVPPETDVYRHLAAHAADVTIDWRFATYHVNEF